MSAAAEPGLRLRADAEEAWRRADAEREQVLTDHGRDPRPDQAAYAIPVVVNHVRVIDKAAGTDEVHPLELPDHRSPQWRAWTQAEQAWRLRSGRRWAAALPRDADGDRVVLSEHIGWWKVTDCCGATVTGTESGIACRSCYSDQDFFPDGPAVWDEGPRMTPPAIETAVTVRLK